MGNRLINYFLKITPLTKEEIEGLTDTMVVKHFKKGDFLIREGQYDTDTYFILSGCIREYRIIDGNDITTNIFTEEQWIIATDNFEKQKPSEKNLVCVEDTAVVIGDEQKARNVFAQFPRLETISRKIIESVFVEQQNLLNSFITDSPEERYLKLLNARPDIFQRVPQYDIATYIGVKPESLSRIRRKLQMKQERN